MNRPIVSSYIHTYHHHHRARERRSHTVQGKVNILTQPPTFRRDVKPEVLLRTCPSQPAYLQRNKKLLRAPGRALQQRLPYSSVMEKNLKDKVKRKKVQERNGGFQVATSPPP